jgi:hypothetical protein
MYKAKRRQSSFFVLNLPLLCAHLFVISLKLSALLLAVVLSSFYFVVTYQIVSESQPRHSENMSVGFRNLIAAWHTDSTAVVLYSIVLYGMALRATFQNICKTLSRIC